LRSNQNHSPLSRAYAAKPRKLYDFALYLQMTNN
jgi:hypothetical protein